MSEVEFKKLAICDTCGAESLCREVGVDDQCGGCYWAPINEARHQSELAALREELERQKHYVEINANSAHGKHKEGQQYKDERDALREDLAAIIANRNDLKQRLTVTEQRNAELVELLKKSRRSIDPSCSGKALRMELDAALKPTESGVSE